MMTSGFQTVIWVLCLVLGSRAEAVGGTAAARSDGRWETIEPGFQYRRFDSTGGDNVFVVRMRLEAGSDRTIDSCIAQGQWHKEGLPYGGRETVSGMAKRNDDGLIYHRQGWGQRIRIVAAINGDYWERAFLPDGPHTGLPQNGQVVSGWFARRYSEFAGGSAFFFTLDGIPRIGGDVRNGASPDCPQQVVFADGSAAALTGINVARGPTALVLFTPQWGGSTHTDAAGFEVLAQVDRPLLPIAHGTPTPSCAGRVVETGVHGNTRLLFDHVVLSGSGPHAELLRRQCPTGAVIQLRAEICDYGFPASVRTPPHPPQDWTGAFAAIGTDRELLIDGQITNLPKTDAIKRARTGVAFNKEYVYFAVADESSPGGKSGMTFGELAAFCREALGATHACSLDGGGSSCLWIRGKGIVNRPSDGRERMPCNGLLMAAVESAEKPASPPSRQQIMAASGAILRSGPGLNSPVITEIPRGIALRLESHPLNGCRATHQKWWYVRFGDLTGWVAEK